MTDANTDRMHSHHAEEERRERIGQRADEILNDMVAEDANKPTVIQEILSEDLVLCDLVIGLLATRHLRDGYIDQIRERLYALLRVRRCEDAQEQAEQEEGACS